MSLMQALLLKGIPVSSGPAYEAYWTMDDISGSTINDDTGNYPGTFSGAITATGVDGNALRNDNSSDSISFDVSGAGGSFYDFTIAAKLYVDSANPTANGVEQLFIIEDVTNGELIAIPWDHNSSNLIRKIHNAYGVGIYQYPLFTRLSYVSIIVSVTAGTLKWYEDGVLKGSGPMPTSYDYNVEIVHLGYGANNESALCRYDEVYYFNRGISDAEAAALAA